MSAEVRRQTAAACHWVGRPLRWASLCRLASAIVNGSSLGVSKVPAFCCIWAGMGIKRWCKHQLRDTMTVACSFLKAGQSCPVGELDMAAFLQVALLHRGREAELCCNAPIS